METKINYTEILRLLQEPIENFCYMVTMEWWNQWIQHNTDTTHKHPEPGSISNYTLVELGDEYCTLLMTYYENVTSGRMRLNNWCKMVLRSDIKEGVDYILHRKMLSEKYGTSAEICIFIVETAPFSTNCLHTPYKGGYPDFSPIRMYMHNLHMQPIDEKHYLGVLISLGCTCKQLYQYVSQNFQAGPFTLRLNNEMLHQNHDANQGVLIPESDDTLSRVGFGMNSEIVIAPPYTSVNPANEGTVLLHTKIALPILVEELFDGLDAYKEKAKEPPKSPLEEEENKKLQKEFETELKKSEEAINRGKLNFHTPSLETLVNSMELLGKELSNIIAKNE